MSQATQSTTTPEIRPDSPREALRLQRIRKDAEDAIERLIPLVDSLDPDPDLEPTMGGTLPGLDECEPDSDGEPSLGWTHDEAHAGGNLPATLVWDADLEFGVEDAPHDLRVRCWALPPTDDDMAAMREAQRFARLA